MAEGPARFVSVAVPAPLLEPLTYSVPDAWAASVRPGERVRVPLGRRLVVGLVLGPSPAPAQHVEVKPLLERLDAPGMPALTADLLEVVRWTTDYYLAPPGDVLRAALPAAIAPDENPWMRLTDSGRLAARLAGAPPALAWLASRPGGRVRQATLLARLDEPAEIDTWTRAEWIALESSGRGSPALRHLLVPAAAVRRDPETSLAALARSPARRRALETALVSAPLSAGELARAAGVRGAAVSALVRAGLLAPVDHVRPAAELPDPGFASSGPLRLTADQQRAVRQLVAWIDAGGYQPVVLFGITGSGKT
ncbi:MAG: hypothetical protein JSV80_06555 [Acidobacteriota bacterium]|nr:MAG: hypothetical protein JSV80_06555 [Acidobacteriota bacterium]